MKKIICFVVVFMAMLTCGICLLSPKVQEVHADVAGTDGAQFILTGYAGNSPKSYFTTSTGASRLVNAQEKTPDKKYLNKKGESVDTFYFLTGQHKSSSKAKSSGICEIYPSTEMKKIIGAGQMMIKASAGLLALNDELRSKVDITVQIVAGGKVVETLTLSSDKVSTNDEVYEPDWVETKLVELPSNTEKIVYSFENRKETDRLYAAKFCIFEPCVFFATNLNECKMIGQDQSIKAGQVLKLSASNIVTSQTSNSDYFVYYKKIHKIKYEIVEGQQYAKIVDNYLYVNEDMPFGEKIKVRAKCRKSSLSAEYIYSSEITFVFDIESTTLVVEKDFEDPAKFLGEGRYFVGDYATVSVQEKEGFEFVGWEISGEIVSDSNSYTFRIEKDQKIKAKFTKTIKIAQLVPKTKIYDGTTDVQFDVVLDGVETVHDVDVEFFARFATSNVGQSKKIEFLKVPQLCGEDAELYLLDGFVPSVVGTIVQRELKIEADELSKVYGDNDPVLTFSADGLVEGERVVGALSRQTGEDAGEYEIVEGDVALKNPNYRIDFVGATFEIEKREIVLSNVGVVSKVFDQTTDAQIFAQSQNIILEDDVELDFFATFDDASVGNNKVVTLSRISILGNDAKNYFVQPFEGTLFGIITPKRVDVVVEEQSFSYGDEIDIEYCATGLLGEDLLSGELAISSNQVGSYVVSVGTLMNPNYEIVLNAQLVHIVAKKIVVCAIDGTKAYGDSDPTLQYVATGLVEGDTLGGSLARAEGEEVGRYEIGIGTLFNDNYEIDFQSATFVVVKREVEISFDFEDKIYDGTTRVDFCYSILNALKKDDVQFDIDFCFESPDVGANKQIVINKFEIVGKNIDRYEKKFNSNMFFASIVAKDVEISANSIQKTYGESDPIVDVEFDGVVEGEAIVGALTREQGEDVGTYYFEISDSMKFQNKNYNLSFKQDVFLTIVQKNVELKILSQQKQFGDSDPQIQYSFDESCFGFDETFESLKTGAPRREEGEEVGRYAFLLGTLSLGKNYKIIFDDEGVLTIAKRDIKIVANDFEKIYGESDPVFSFEAQNSVLNVAPTLNLKREKGENVGKYKITYDSLDDPHYVVDFVAGELEICPCEISVKVEDNFKYFGDADPCFDFVLYSGTLQFDDELSTLLTGSVVRDEGEDVGDYEINQGSLTAGDNYDLTFVSGKLSILIQELVLKIGDLTKFYGDDDPDFVYVVESGNLAGYEFVGTAQRQEGESVGTYEINKGTLEISANFDVRFVCGTLKILPRPIVVTALASSKVYGEGDPEFCYEISSGNLIDENDLSGGLYREHVGEKIYENVGKYPILSNLDNPNYEISYCGAQLSILQREIVVSTTNVSSVYGEEIVTTFDYVLKGEILEGDELSGGLYKPEGEDVGVYPIRCNINIGRNYKVKYVQAYYEILPIKLIVTLGENSKIYYNPDPIYSLEIVSGNMIEGQVLEWEVERDDNENVGVYDLTAKSLDDNYVLETIDSTLEILKKDVKLNLEVLDKPYDGTNVCKIKNPIVSGLVDNEIVIDYDKNNCAQFASIMPANNIPVTLLRFELVGNGADNYNLLLPTGLFANITYSSLESQNVEVSTFNSTIMKFGTTLSVEEIDVGAEYNGKKILQSLNVSLLDAEGNSIFVDNALRMTIDVDNLNNCNNIHIYGKNAAGNYVELTHKIVGNELVVSTSNFSDFIVVCDNENWIDILVAVFVGLFVGIGLCVLIIDLKKKRNK